MRRNKRKTGKHIYVYRLGSTGPRSKVIPNRTVCHATFYPNTILNGQEVYMHNVLVHLNSNGFPRFHRAVTANLDSAIKTFFFNID